MSRHVEEYDEAPLIDVGRYVRDIARAWWLIIPLMVLGGVAGYLFVPTSAYQSTALVQVNPGLVDLAQVGSGVEPNLSTEQTVATSRSVLDVAAEDLGVSASTIEGRLTVSNTPSSSTLTFTYRGTTSESAQEGAQASSEAYLEQRQVSAEESLADSQQQLRDVVSSRVREQVEAQRTADQAPAGSRERQEAEITADLAAQRVRNAQEKVNAMDSFAVQPGEIISPATPGEAAGITAPLGAVLGALAGGLLAVVLAVLLGRRRASRQARRGSRATRASSGS